jgi:hypothetical protein
VLLSCSVAVLLCYQAVLLCCCAAVLPRCAALIARLPVVRLVVLRCAVSVLLSGWSAGCAG